MKVARCHGITKDGRPCNAKPLPGETRCPWHSPAWADRRKDWSAKGGQNRSNQRRAKKQLPAEPLTAEEVRAHLGVVFLDVIGGTVEPGVGTAAANIARALMDVARVAEVEEEIAQLRRDMAAFAERRGVS